MRILALSLETFECTPNDSHIRCLLGFCQDGCVVVLLENSGIGLFRTMPLAKLCLWIGSVFLELIIMTQHFLLSAALRDFSLKDILDMSEDDAMMFFAEHRWKSRDHQVCPQCGLIDNHYFRTKRRQWKCKSCEHCFSVTSGMVFDGHRLPYKLLLTALLFTSAAQGMSALQMSRLLGIQAKSAATFEGKLKEVLVKQANRPLLKGIIHVDGGHFGGKPRRARRRRKITPEEVMARINQKGSAKRKRYQGCSQLNLKKKANKRVTYVLRELDAEGKKAVKTIVCVGKTENERDALAFIHRYVEKGSTIMSDENPAYSKLNTLGYTHMAVQHSIEYCRDDGVNENQAESFFSRLRRMEYGTTHRITPTYLMDYSQEMAWREDTRTMTTLEKITELLKMCNKNGLSEWWRGYWQGNRRGDEILLNDLLKIEDSLRT